jgi:predicted dehydrogenase
MTDPLHVALIGCGRIAQVAHLPALEKADGIEVVAVCDPSAAVAQAVAARYGIASAVTDDSEVLADDSVEAVIVAAPDRFHYDLTRKALHAGKHVLVEKPLASTPEQAQELVDLVASTGLALQVGAMKRHDAGLQWAHDFTRDTLGEPRSFNAWYRIGDLRAGIEATLFPRVYADETARQAEAGFKADRQRYLLATHGAHIFDTVRYLLGDVASIQAIHRGYGRDHAWTVLMTMTSGLVGSVTITVDVPGVPSEGIEIFGSVGALRVDIPFPFSKQASEVHAYAHGQMVIPVLTDGDPYERQAEAFAAAVRTGSAPTPDALDGLAAVVLIQAAQTSADTEQAVRI